VRPLLEADAEWWRQGMLSDGDSVAVNRALVAMYKRGDIDAVYQQWLAPLGRPSPLLNAMFYLNALPD